MRFLIALGAIAIPLASTPAHTPTAEGAKPEADARVKPLGGGRSDCRRSDLHPAESVGKGRFNRLGELPPGQFVLTVYREVDGCPDPLIVGQPIGLGEPMVERAPQPMMLPPRRW